MKSLSEVIKEIEDKFVFRWMKLIDVEESLKFTDLDIFIRTSLREIAQITKESLEVEEQKQMDSLPDYDSGCIAGLNEAHDSFLTKWEEFNK